MHTTIKQSLRFENLENLEMAAIVLVFLALNSVKQIQRDLEEV